MKDKVTIHPLNINASTTQQTIEELATDYGKKFAANKEVSIIDPDYDAWLNPIRERYPLNTYDSLTKLIENNPIPKSGESTDRQHYRTEQNFKSAFLIIVAADVITYEYCNNSLERVPPKIFEQIYDTHGTLHPDLCVAIACEGFGCIHPDVDHESAVFSDRFADTIELRDQLNTMFVLNPERATSFYENILENGHPLFTGDPIEAYTWTASFAAQFAALEIEHRDGTGHKDKLYTREESVLEKAGYPHREYRYRKLAEITNNHVSYDNFEFNSHVQWIQSELPPSHQ